MIQISVPFFFGILRAMCAVRRMFSFLLKGLLLNALMFPAYAYQYHLEQHLFSGIISDVNQRVLPTPFHKGLITVAGDDLKIYELSHAERPARITLPAFLTASPAINTKKIFVVDEKAEILAFDRKKLRLQWRRALSNQAYAAPVADDKIVVVKMIDGVIKAFSAETGKLLWQHRHQHPSLTLSSDSRALLLPHDVIASFPNGKVYDYERTTGKIRWKTWLDLSSEDKNENISARPADLQYDGERIFASVPGKQVIAIRQNDGAILWQRDISAEDSFLFFPAQKILVIKDTEQNIWALQSEQGETLWKQSLSEKTVGWWRMNKEIGVATQQGHLNYYSPENGALLGTDQFTKTMAYVIRGLPMDYLFVARLDGIIDVLHLQHEHARL